MAGGISFDPVVLEPVVEEGAGELPAVPDPPADCARHRLVIEKRVIRAGANKKYVKKFFERLVILITTLDTLSLVLAGTNFR